MLAFARGESVLADSIVQNEVETTRRLIQYIESYNAEDKTAFVAIISASINRGLAQAEIAAEFGVSPGTVSRWVAGKSIPAQYSRDTIVHRIGKLLENLAEEQLQFA